MYQKAWYVLISQIFLYMLSVAMAQSGIVVSFQGAINTSSVCVDTTAFRQAGDFL